MARNGSGIMSIVNTLVDGTTITAGAHNQNNTDIASEVTNSLALDGQSSMTGQFKSASGTVAAPGMVFGSDLDTGLYRIAGDNAGFACAGAKVLDISATGLDVTGALSIGGVAKTAATETVAGFVELATDAETQTGTDTARAITPANLTARSATETRTGIAELATTAEAATGTDTERITTPAGVKAYVDGILASQAEAEAGTSATKLITALRLSHGLPAMAYAETAATATLSGTIPVDDTIPQSGEGDQILTADITLKRADSRVRVSFEGAAGSSTDSWLAVVALFWDGSANALNAKACRADADGGNQNFYNMNISVEHSPGSVGPFTYQARMGGSSASYAVNGSNGGRLFGGAARCTLTLQEVFA
jgi:hypothetical protein